MTRSSAGGQWRPASTPTRVVERDHVPFGEGLAVEAVGGSAAIVVDSDAEVLMPPNPTLPAVDEHSDVEESLGGGGVDGGGGGEASGGEANGR